MNTKITTLLILLLNISIFSQQTLIKGTIINSKTKEPIKNAIIKQRNSEKYTETDNDGKFKISTDLKNIFTIIHMNFSSKTITLFNNIVIELNTKPIDLDNIIITANLLKDISLSNTILDNTKASSQPRNITDLFKEVNGFGVQKRGAYASEPIFRAFRYEQLNIQFDGASKILNACPNRMDPITTHIIPEEIEKIELIKGPFTVRFGENFGGIINLVSKEPSKENKGIVGSVETGYESNGNNLITRGTIQYATDKFDILSNGSYRDYGDYKDGNGTEVASSFKTTDYSIKLGYNPTDNQRFKLHFRQSFGREITHAGLPMDSPFDDSYLIGLDYKINKVSDIINSITFKSFYSDVEHLMTNHNRPNFTMVDAATNVFATTYGGKIEFSLSPNENSMLFAGIDANLIGREGDRIRKIKIMNGNILPTPVIKTDKVWQDATLNDFGVFAELKYKLTNKTTVTTGARADFVSSSIDDPAIQMIELYGEIEDKTETNLSGNIAIKHKLKGTQLQLALGRGTRKASMIERYINHFNIGIDAYEYMGNPNLDPEINNQIEFSYKKQYKKINIGTNIFYSIIENYITAIVNLDIPRLFMPTTPPIFVKQFINVDQAVQTGFEFNFDYKATKHLTFATNTAYTYAKNKDFNEPLAQIQPLTVNINTIYEKKNYWLKLNAHFVANQDRISTTFQETESDDYATFDFSAGIKPTKNLTIGASVLNILDKAYFDHLNFSFKNSNTLNGRIFEPGRNFTAYAKYKF